MVFYFCVIVLRCGLACNYQRCQPQRYEFGSFASLALIGSNLVLLLLWSLLVLQLGGTVRHRNLSNVTHALAMIIMRDNDNENMCNAHY